MKTEQHYRSAVDRMSNKADKFLDNINEKVGRAYFEIWCFS